MSDFIKGCVFVGLIVSCVVAVCLAVRFGLTTNEVPTRQVNAKIIDCYIDSSGTMLFRIGGYYYTRNNTSRNYVTKFELSTGEQVTITSSKVYNTCKEHIGETTLLQEYAIERDGNVSGYKYQLVTK